MTAKEINLPSKIEEIEKAVGEVTAFAASAGFSEEALFAVDLALREALANAIKHGNKLDETKQVQLAFKATGDALEITVRDFGSGFTVEDVPDPTDPENLLKASGRGILFMNNFMDELDWTNHPEGGMIVKMLKKR